MNNMSDIKSIIEPIFSPVYVTNTNLIYPTTIITSNEIHQIIKPFIEFATNILRIILDNIVHIVKQR